MFVEDLESVPEEMRPQFEEFELDGKKGFSDKGSIALYNSLKNAKNEREQYRTQLDETKGKLSEFEATQSEKIEAAKAKALEDAKNNKDVDAIEKRYQEQMLDLEKRVREEERQNVTTEFAEKSATQRANATAEKIGLMLGIDKDSSEVISELIRGRIKGDTATEQNIYHDASGSALSVDTDGFIAELKKEKRFSRLIKAEFTTVNGGLVNGSNSRVSDSNTKQSDTKAYKGDMNAYLKDNLKINQ